MYSHHVIKCNSHMITQITYDHAMSDIRVTSHDR